MSQDADVILIGAGHNGLVCGAYLAKAGLDVLIVERSHRIGGGCVTEELTPGCHFSTFAYNANGPGPKICHDLEISAHAFEVVEPEPRLLSPFPDGDYLLWWGDPQKTAHEIARFGAHEADGFIGYQQFMQRAKEIAQEVFLQHRPPRPEELTQRYQGTPHAPVLEALLTRSHWDVLNDYFTHEKVKCALARADDCGYPTAVGSLLAEVLESANDGAGIERKSGVVRGGMGKVSAALADAARRYGATIRTESPVESILVEQERACGVRLQEGNELRARIVVSNADPKRTFLRLLQPDQIPPAFRRDVERIKTRAGYMKYHAVLKGIPKFTCLPTVEVSAARIAPSLAYYEQAWLDAQSGIPARNPILSLQFPTLLIPEMVTPGKQIMGAWVRFAPIQPRDGGWEAWRPKVLESILTTVEKYAPGFRDLIEWQRLYTTADIESETAMTDASIRHVDMTLDQVLHRRPLPAWSAYKTPLDGLWLCGSGTHPCGSVTGAPGHNAARAILESIA